MYITHYTLYTVLLNTPHYTLTASWLELSLVARSPVASQIDTQEMEEGEGTVQLR